MMSFRERLSKSLFREHDSKTEALKGKAAITMAWREQFWIPCELFANRAEDLTMRILCIYMLQNKTKQNS
jgi:hypothetical protein